jgi:DNA-directed RNA polymerase subunit RPC12/RpoP
MIDVMYVYDCFQCGKRLEDQVEQNEIIDTENDEVYHILVCSTCYDEVFPRMIDGKHAMETVDHDRFMWYQRESIGGRQDGDND